MELEKVEYTCPQCGVTWTEWQDTKDDWFRLATNQTLCANCGKEAMKRIVADWERKTDEDIFSWPRSHG